ncbi:MAG TPA: hypothetical protein VG965_02460 [Patescibacteria group bacterium]|nr:hypothetical protein [Patescibacteria group bacterium]
MTTQNGIGLWRNSALDLCSEMRALLGGNKVTFSVRERKWFNDQTDEPTLTTVLNGQRLIGSGITAEARNLQDYATLCIRYTEGMYCFQDTDYYREGLVPSFVFDGDKVTIRDMDGDDHYFEVTFAVEH